MGCHALLRGSSNPDIEPESLWSPALVGGFFTTSTTWEKPSSPKPEWLKLPTVQGPTWIWSFQPEGGAVTPPPPSSASRRGGQSGGLGTCCSRSCQMGPGWKQTGSPAKANSAWSPRVLQKSEGAVPGLQLPEPVHCQQGRPQPVSSGPGAAPPAPHEHSPGIRAGVPS